MIKECKETLKFVDLPSGEYASWLAQDAWKILARAELLGSTDAANALLYYVALAANYKAKARRSISFRDIDASLASAKDSLAKAEKIPDDFVEKSTTVRQSTLALLRQARDIEAGTRRLLRQESEKEYIKDLSEYIREERLREERGMS
jgi:hypothetical protein